ncbi:uncharacterized protein LOC124264299 [Haliotis rubra]|uniref:uncharacterized protein LOC124264299 n=1 Tax=Haliotis rubra TaxID=36100 RepID=UPI001EE54EF5|nr:uncharacterized protein LOC124264299 [Haliotis rubra]XP_046555009.1 uncharacterized protein LOC124264299 [Haliotis rubra]
MDRNPCVMCELASTVDIMPVGKSLNKFGLLSKDIYHDLQKSSMNEGIKWRGLLHSLNFQENKLARITLVELVRIDNPDIADELEKPDFRRQIGCVCGQRTSGPRLKRSNSLPHIGDTSGNQGLQAFSFEGFNFGAFNNSFPQSAENQDDKTYKYMSLQVSKSPDVTPSPRRRSRSLEILRPFIPLERETFMPMDSSESDLDDEIDFLFAGITDTSLGSEGVADFSNEDITKTMLNENHSDNSKGNPEDDLRTPKDDSTLKRNMQFDENFFPSSSGMGSTSSVDTVEHVSLSEQRNSVFLDDDWQTQDSYATGSDGATTSEDRKSINTATSTKQKLFESLHAGDRDEAELLVSTTQKTLHSQRRQVSPASRSWTLQVTIALFLLPIGLLLLPRDLLFSIVALVALQVYTDNSR